jgi:hypothetical protein
MEKDIKRLEELVDNVFKAEDDEIIEIDIYEASAIIRLIKRNKELEEIEKEHQKENGELREKVKELEEMLEINDYIDFHKLLQDKIYYKKLASEYQGNCIPKSIIKEKIEDSKEDSEKYSIDEVYYDLISILEELLEDK